MGRGELCLLVVLGLLFPATATAAPRDPAQADALFRAGREAFKRGDYAAACAHFERSEELDPAAGTALNLAECEERLGHTASAWHWLRDAVGALPPDDDRLPDAKEKLPRLEARVPKLVIRVRPGASSNARVLLDGKVLDPAAVGVPEPVNPGKHQVEVRSAGHRAATFSVELADGQASTLDVNEGPAAPTKAGEAEASTASSDMTTTGWILVGVGAAGLATTGVTTLLMLGKHDDRAKLCAAGCAEGAELERARNLDQQGRLLSTVSTVSFVIGLGAAAVGAYLLLTQRPPPRKDAWAGVVRF